jgi:ubiquinone/menaquinone biosynthesis C-methylase UbiE
VEGTHGADEPGEGERLSTAPDAASAWSGATYERIAESFTPIHVALVEALEPRPGERFLDVATGTGGVALPAARAGAEVTGLDISADQLAKARTAAEAEGLPIRFDEGDAQELRYEEQSFDVVASAFGVIFATDHARAASELTRVCRHGGRLGITAWPEDDWFRLNRRLRPDYEGATANEWSKEDHVRPLLLEFELRFDRGEWTIEASSAEELWQVLAASVPPLKAWLQTLDAAAIEDVRGEYIPLLGEGRLRREYVRVLGTRR